VTLVLAVTSPDDEHLAPVVEALGRRGVSVALVDQAELPTAGGLTFSTGDGPGRWRLALPGGATVDAADVTAVWWRRAGAPRPDAGLPYAEATWARLQWEEALDGLWACLGTRLVNDPWREQRALAKPFQLAAAVRAGLQVPPTLVTSDPAQARAFVAAQGRGRVVRKALHGTDEREWTQLLGRGRRADLQALRLAPAILQRFVPGLDVRVTAVGRRLFACEIDARRSASPEDFRAVFEEVPVRPCALPAGLAAAIRRLMADLGLAYGALDFRRGDGGWSFLEVNPAGQFLGFERRAGLPISEALAALLARDPGNKAKR
jgi:hypothetical protein